MTAAPLVPVATPAPTLESARLVLRPHVLDDYAELAALWGDAEVTRHIGGRPFTREESWHRLLRYVGHWQLLGYGFWAVVDKASGRYAGNVGFGEFMREMEPPIELAPEVGWVMAPWTHGRGLGTEAVQTALAWGDAHFDGGRTTCIINPGNAPSLRVAHKCGFRELMRASYHGEPALVLERRV